MNSNLLKVRFSAAFLFLIYTIVVKVAGAEAADTLLTVALVLSAACLSIALYEVVTSHLIERAKKTLWVVALLLLSWPAMLYYVFAARKHVRNVEEFGIRDWEENHQGTKTLSFTKDSRGSKRQHE